jgi:hypothetical protein
MSIRERCRFLNNIRVTVEWQRFARRLKRGIHEALKLVINSERIGEDAYDRCVANLYICLADMAPILNSPTLIPTNPVDPSRNSVRHPA